MRSFLVKNKRPVCKWSILPDGIYYKGKIPAGYDLAVSPTPGYIIVDVDRHGDKIGFDHIPNNLKLELAQTLTYPTRNNGRHYWFKYTGNVNLANKPSGLGIDLRTHKGYVVWYQKEEFQSCVHKIRETSKEMNEWLEMLFYGKSINRKKK